MIGILQPKGGTGFQDQDDQVMVPIGTVSKYFVAGDDVRTIGVSVADADADDASRPRSPTLLRTRHGLAATDDADFTIFDQAQLLETANVDQRHADAAARRHRLDLARSSAASGS